MIKPALIIRHLIFTGPARQPANLFFKKGLNVLYGASETGKSFALEAIDYMLGGKELRDIPERVGYDRVLLGIEVTTGECFTLVRSTSGGQFLVFDGLLETHPDDESGGVVLVSKHQKDNKDNISTFLLSKIGLQDDRLKSNARGETKSLSFRNLWAGAKSKCNIFSRKMLHAKKIQPPIVRGESVDSNATLTRIQTCRNCGRFESPPLLHHARACA